MVVDPFWLGVGVTLFVELVVIFILAIMKGMGK